ncbi:MAG: response regulator transcription factor [Gemmataceae bacterium]
MTQLRVFVADDHPVVRGGLRGLIDAQPDMAVVGEAYDGTTAAGQVVAVRPDVVVMDVSMPGGGGAAATERIRRAAPGVKVLALTAHEDRGYLRLMLAAGASGYVLKRAAAAELVRAIRCVAGGEVYLDPAVAGELLPAAPADPPAVELSDRETEVVRLIALGYSNKEIAARLGLSVKTVETYKARSLEKLGLHSRVDLVRYATRRGWLADP